MNLRYSLRKCKSILRAFFSWYQLNREKLPKKRREEIEADLLRLDQAILQGRKKEASLLAKRFRALGKELIRRPFLRWLFDLVGAVAVALAIALVVRQGWFELYEIPTGSMRPTFFEQDRLIVSKTAFGIDYPFANGHLYFDPELVKRSGVVIWSGHGIDLPDTDTLYFGFIPFKKQYVKRCLGKPGDLLYFYGGQVYGMDSEGNELPELRESPWMKKKEYVPFLSFEGRLREKVSKRGNEREWLLQHFGLPVGRIVFGPSGLPKGEIRVQGEWVADRGPAASLEAIGSYSDFWGIGNYAMARLLSKQQAQELPYYPEVEADYYLELAHSPSLSGMMLNLQKTLLPLDREDLKRLRDNLYTSRFVVRGGYAAPYHYSHVSFSEISSPYLPGVPDGTYEFYEGEAYRIGAAGWREKLSKEHPLYAYSLTFLQTLFNYGIDMDLTRSSQFPRRYAYFREGALYVMGGPLFKRGEAALKAFLEREERRAKSSSYRPFVDQGPPLKEDGSLDREKIRTFGLPVPEKGYLMLGDNHANSGDSRVFGFVPEANLKGAPTLRFWPPGSSWTLPSQRLYPWFTLPNCLIWSLALLALIVWRLHAARSLKQPVIDPKTFES